MLELEPMELLELLELLVRSVLRTMNDFMRTLSRFYAYALAHV